mmetsp:Transcript_2429/g.3547  ORF Transcript_2429/g.3547 Transcript_2429/m.3547 type:complete len:151 (-) Transcript_2429:70-522(-)
MNFEAIPLLLFSSIIYVVASATICIDYSCKNEQGYALIVGAVSLIIVAVLFFEKIMSKSNRLGPAHKYISVFLSIWWLFGAAFGTFNGPFIFPGNGYFSGWVSFLLSAKYAIQSNKAVKDIVARGASALNNQGLPKDEPRPVEEDTSTSV